MTSAPNRVAWADHAACQGYDLDEFFGDSKLRVTQAKRVCGRCPVREQCLDLALRSEDQSRYGIFGGLTASERGELANRKPAVA